MGHPENGSLERQNILENMAKHMENMGKHMENMGKDGKDGKMRKYDHQN